MNRLVHHLAHQASWKMSQLLPDPEKTPDQKGVAGKVLLLPTFQQGFFWASALGAGVLLLLLWPAGGPEEGALSQEASTSRAAPEA
ncbi:inositol -trisphosphate receptor-interacting 1 [Limosa lapponica baueri]|uniref:Inositol-trisphosphate receptor-interacting 1 n=1 Tax=Limosa lapponica baueri TaxID=1758121 RepID=A0A2I0UG76_LIMLA|nr:inositol -trisphosphate receptor-interacting 1 [Limosa lapponica baueri]